MPLVILSALLLFAVILFSGLVPLLWRWHPHQLSVLTSLGGGILLSAAFFHMLPEAASQLGEDVGLYVMVGFLLLFLIEKFSMAHACGEHDHHHGANHQLGLSAFFGLSAHSLAGGIALGVGLSTGSKVGFAILLATVVHKVPESIALSALLISAGWTKRRALITLFAYSLVTPIGIFLGVAPFLGTSSSRGLGIAMAIATGSFIYLAAGDLLPSMHRRDPYFWRNLIAFLIGILFLGIWSRATH